MQIIAMLLKLPWPIVERRYVFMLGNPMKDLSAEHDVAGIVSKIEHTV